MGHNRTLRSALAAAVVGGRLRQEKSRSPVIVTALDGISFEINDGDRVGLVGHNGAGKTTLLRTIAGVYPPISGKVQISGKVSALFNQQLGIDMDESGIDNIRSVGLYLGLSPREIESKIEDIVEFSELDEFVSLPVRTYSTGMLTRLAFSIVTSFKPDILLIDEGIGTGDARFEERARARVNEFMKNSSIIVLASHSHAMVQQMCNKAMLLEHGKLIAFSDVDSVFKLYSERSA